MTDTLIIVDKTEKTEENEMMKDIMKDIIKDLQGTEETEGLDKLFLDSMTKRFHFTAEGRRCKRTEAEESSFYKGIIDNAGFDVGEEVYVVDYNEGYDAAYTIGWLVIFDVDQLFSEVFKERESILSTMKSDSEKNISRSFLSMLDEKGIRYGEDYVNMD